MTSWSTKRQFLYGGSFLLIVAVIALFLFFKFFYHRPTCNDGLKNGRETGIDCGGSCKNLCTSDALAPVVLWSRIFNISGDVYSAVAYIENPNINSRNKKTTYQFKIYDANNKLVTVREGETEIPKGKKFAVFESGIIIKHNKPKSADFQFLTFDPWQKDSTKDPSLSLNYSALINPDISPRIEGTISNDSLSDVGQVELDVFVLDGKENAIAASRTFVDRLLSRQSQDFVFTWPKPFDLGVAACTKPFDIAISLDKSKDTELQLATTTLFDFVKTATTDFINNLTPDDAVSVVSFDNKASLDSPLDNNKQLAVSAVGNIILSTSTKDNAKNQKDIAGGLNTALLELESKIRSDSKKILILISNGVFYKSNNEQTNSQTILAQSAAQNVNSSGVSLYIMALGKGADTDFLKSMTIDDAHYFAAQNFIELQTALSQIVSSSCQRKPNVIIVVYRVL